jgi:hypothetical protein
MKLILGIKLFLVLCCQTTDSGQYRYEVKDLNDTTQTGVFYTKVKFSEGDTIKLTDY